MFQNLEPIYLAIAYGGLLIHILLQLGERPGTVTISGIKGAFSNIFSTITKRDIFVTISSIILIPILLELCSEAPLKDVLPINKLTAFLAGYQTQELTKKILSISSARLGNQTTT